MAFQKKHDPFVPSLSISALFDISSLGHNNCIVVNQKERDFTRRELKHDRDIIAKAFLALDIKPGDIIMVATNRSLYDSIAIFLAANKIGAVVSFLDEKSTRNTLISYLNEFKSPLLITYDKKPEYRKEIKGEVKTLKHVINLDGTSTLEGMEYRNSNVAKLAEKYHGKLKNNLFGGQKEALITFTSGSTSGPKPMVFTNQNLIAAAMFPKDASGIKMWDKNITSWMSYVRFDCPYGLWTSVMTPILGGSSVILTPDINADNFDYYFAKNPSAISGVPLLLEELEKYLSPEIDLSGVKMFISGGERLEENASKNAIDFFKQHGATTKICNGYGVGEALGCISIAVGATYRPGTVGKIVSGVHPLILDPETDEVLGYGKTGILYVGGKHILRRYFNRPELDDEKIITIKGEKYIKTGDLAYINENGFITLIGRAMFFINNIPAKVYYEVVRTAVARSEVVKNCYVVKKSDTKLGYVTVAFVVLKDGIPKNDSTRKQIAEDMQKIFYIGKRRIQLKSYEMPKKIVFLDELPQTKANKTDFRKLERMTKEL